MVDYNYLDLIFKKNISFLNISDKITLIFILLLLLLVIFGLLFFKSFRSLSINPSKEVIIFKEDGDALSEVGINILGSLAVKNLAALYKKKSLKRNYKLVIRDEDGKLQLVDPVTRIYKANPLKPLNRFYFFPFLLTWRFHNDIQLIEYKKIAMVAVNISKIKVEEGISKEFLLKENGKLVFVIDSRPAPLFGKATYGKACFTINENYGLTYCLPRSPEEIRKRVRKQQELDSKKNRKFLFDLLQGILSIWLRSYLYKLLEDLKRNNQN